MSGGKFGQNYTSVLSRYCRGNVPRSCEYNLLNETRNRPCLISESYVSSSEFLTLEVKNTESTALRPLTFRLKYEFVDLQQDGIPAAAHFASQERPANQSVTGTQHVTSAATSSDCHRRFVSSLMERKDVNVFKSARNVFFFGRGGAKNLSCVHRFEAQRGERVRVVMRRVMTGRNRTCESRVDDDTNRSYCFGDPRVRVEVSGDLIQLQLAVTDSLLFRPDFRTSLARLDPVLPGLHVQLDWQQFAHFQRLAARHLHVDQSRAGDPFHGHQHDGRRRSGAHPVRGHFRVHQGARALQGQSQEVRRQWDN